MTSRIHYQSFNVENKDNETVLESLLRVGAPVPFSCKSGVCHTCLLKCTSGDIPAEANRGLPLHLQRARYLLACRCHPQTELHLEEKHPDDMLHECMLLEMEHTNDGNVTLRFESTREFPYQVKQFLRIVTGDEVEPEIVLTSTMVESPIIEATYFSAVNKSPLPWLADADIFGQTFQARGPFESHPPEHEQAQPGPNLALWQSLGNGTVVRAVLEAFYAKVYQDQWLAPFFERVTQDRAIDKQYSFLKQCMTGEKIFMGDRPRNSHHWMLISQKLFDYRQAIMIETLQEHGVTPEQIQQWTSFEEHYRTDIVKDHAWPRTMGTESIMLEGFSKELILEATVCDHCAQEVQSGTTVLMHRRLGTITCPDCAPHALSPLVESNK